MKLENFFGQKAEAQPKTLRALTEEERREVSGGYTPTPTSFSKKTKIVGEGTWNGNVIATANS